ncbi:MAG: hypothetical protein JO323_06790, partial [Acidobacteriia bacterium]|nr:hypothetical protein [Terriglobia bacterium]
LLRRAVDLGLPDELLFRTLWDAATIERRMGQTDAALESFAELTASRNPYRARAFEALAKHYEHRERDLPMALEMTQRGLALTETASMRRRELRLLTRLGQRMRT